jgi:uncharacterized membrane protein
MDRNNVVHPKVRSNKRGRWILGPLAMGIAAVATIDLVDPKAIPRWMMGTVLTVLLGVGVALAASKKHQKK